MGRLKVYLENPLGNLKVKVGESFEVIVGATHERGLPGIEINYDKNYLLTDINLKSQNLSIGSSSQIKWKFVALKSTAKPIGVTIVVTKENLIQACAFNLEIE